MIAIAASADFLNNFKNFVLLLLMVFTPWSAINLTDYYLVSKERVDIPALYDPDGPLRALERGAIATYAFGVLVADPVPGPVALHRAGHQGLGGADISWIVGLVVPGVIYYLWANRRPVAPDRMIRAAEAVDHERSEPGESGQARADRMSAVSSRSRSRTPSGPSTTTSAMSARAFCSS